MDSAGVTAELAACYRLLYLAVLGGLPVDVLESQAALDGLLDQLSLALRLEYQVWNDLADACLEHDLPHQRHVIDELRRLHQLPQEAP